MHEAAKSAVASASQTPKYWMREYLSMLARAVQGRGSGHYLTCSTRTDRCQRERERERERESGLVVTTADFCFLFCFCFFVYLFCVCVRVGGEDKLK